MTSDMRQDGMERAYIEWAREADPQTRSFDLDRPLRARRFRRHRRDGGTERRAIFARRRRFLRQTERHKGRGTPTGIPMASRRQVCSNPRLTPHRRANSETFT